MAFLKSNHYGQQAMLHKASPSRLHTLCFFVGLVCLLLPIELTAQEGQPIAIRNWPGGGTTIETMWDLKVGMGINGELEEALPEKLDLKLEDLRADSSVILGRKSNQDQSSFGYYVFDPATGSYSGKSPPGEKNNRVLVTTNSRLPEKSLPYASLFVNGANVLLFTSPPTAEHLKTASKSKFDSKQKFGPAIDLTMTNVSEAACQSIAEAFKPALMIVPRSITQVGDTKVEAVQHNTVAFSTAKRKDAKTRFVSLGDKPYEMSEELETLFAKKEAASEASREFFADLSVEQMNFEPDNGTHTPRWNPEHMMGRELLFFSQIYHAADPTIPVMNLNPKQMPKDYEFAHPDWTGAEEARQMRRVEAFTRRFAYLLDGMDLDKKAKGSRFWTPRGLLKQMERHYSEHTANVKKKMELPGWPEE